MQTMQLFRSKRKSKLWLNLLLLAANETLLKIDANLIIIVARLMSPSSHLPFCHGIYQVIIVHSTDWTWTLIMAHQGGWTRQLSVLQ